MTTTKGRLTVPISESRIAAAKSRAMEVYERTQCSGPGCCGDINGALDTMIRELAEVDTEELISSAVAMGRVAAAKDIDRMPNELGDEGWNTLARRAENAGYDRRMVLRRRRPEEGLTALTIEAAYQHGYRQASEVARGVTPSTGRAESADCCPTCDRARRDGVGLIPDGLGDLTQCDDSWHQD